MTAITSTPTISAELFTIPLEADRFLIYAPLRRAAFVANGRVVNFLAGLKDDKFDAKLDSDGSLVEFLRRMEIVDAGTEHLPITTFEGVPSPISVSLFLTTACNLRCTYCYASAGDKAPKFMSLKTAKRGIDFVAENARRKAAPNFAITYHGGGEPSTNWHVMTESLAYAKERASEFGLGLPLAAAGSNGVLRDDQIDWMVTNLNGGVSVSLDGLPSSHDKHRLTVTGQGSSERVAHTLRRFDEAKFAYGIRVTVTRDQIQHLPDSIDFICTNFGTLRIQVEPAYQLGRWAEAPTAETEEFIEAYREAQCRAAHHGRELFFSGARTDTLSNHFCGVTQDTFALSAEGNVSACYEVFDDENALSSIFFYGQPSDSPAGYQFQLPVLNHLREQAVQNRPFCSGCFAKWTCSGDCYHKAISISGTVEFQGTDRCHITRELTKDQILTRIASSGGLFWHAQPEEQVGQTRGKEALL